MSEVVAALLLIVLDTALLCRCSHSTVQRIWFCFLLIRAALEGRECKREYSASTRVRMNISFLLDCVFSSGGAALWRLVDFSLKICSRTHTHTSTQTVRLIYANTHTHARNIKPSLLLGVSRVSY